MNYSHYIFSTLRQHCFSCTKPTLLCVFLAESVLKQLLYIIIWHFYLCLICRYKSEGTFSRIFVQVSHYNQLNTFVLRNILTMALLFIEYLSQNTSRGKKVYEPPRFMSIANAIEQLLEVEQKRGESGRFLRHSFHLSIIGLIKESEMVRSYEIW